MYQKILGIIEAAKAPLTTTEIAQKAGVNVFEARKNLQRLGEEGKIESVEKEGKICWQKKEEEEDTLRMEKRVHRG